MDSGRETVLANSFHSQYGLWTISGLHLQGDKGRYHPKISMTDSQKDLSQLVAIYFVVFQCIPPMAFIVPLTVWSLPTLREDMQSHTITFVGYFTVGFRHWRLNSSWVLLLNRHYFGYRNTKLTLVIKYDLFLVINSP